MHNTADLAAFVRHLPADGSTIGNGALRTALGWDEIRYSTVKDALLGARKLLKGQGRGGTVRLADASAPSPIFGPSQGTAAGTDTAIPVSQPDVAHVAVPTGPGFSGWVAPPWKDPDAKGLEQRLWDAADELRANSNLKSSQYSAPVLGLIFLRFADVRFQARRRELEAAAAGGSSRRGSQLDVPSAYHASGVIFLPEAARWEHLLNLPEGAGAGAAVNAAMVAVEADNPQLAGTLPRSYESFAGLLLKNLLRKFSEIQVDLGFDAFGRIYEYFLAEFAMSEGQGGGEFYTPSSIVRLLVEVIEPYGGSILDPACGSGGMFVQSAAFVHAHQRLPGTAGFQPALSRFEPVENRRSQEAPPLRIYGQEKESATAALCRMNLAMHGLEGEIREAITYYDDAHAATGKFDYVLANPPFNVDNVDKTRLAGGVGQPGGRFPWGVPTTDNANYLWISLFASALKPGGRAGFVMANSASDARGSELAIRQKMIQEGRVEAMVSVGNNMFYTVTLPVMLWFLGPPVSNRHSSEPVGNRRSQVLFIDARGIYRQIDRAHRDWSDAQIGFLSAIVRVFRGESLDDVVGGDETRAKLREFFPGTAGFQPARVNEDGNDNKDCRLDTGGPRMAYRDVPGLCKAATIAEIEAQGWSLNAGRYVGVEVCEEMGDIDFKNRFETLTAELEILNVQAREIEYNIAKNILVILGAEK